MPAASGTVDLRDHDAAEENPGDDRDDAVCSEHLNLVRVIRPVPSSLWYGLQAGATAALCFELARLFGLSQGYWAGMTAIVVLQSDILGTEKSATDRLYGTAMGAALGWAGGEIGGSEHALIFGLAVTTAVLLCHSLRLESAGRLAGLTVAIVMMSHSTMPLWKVSIYRFFEVSLGIVVAVAVSWSAARFQKFFPNAIEQPPKR